MNKEKFFTYTVYGVNIASAMEMANLPVSKAPADVIIRFGKVPECIEEVKEEGVMYQAGHNIFLLNINQVAGFLVKGGKEIIIEKHQDATEDEIQLFLMGSAFGALLQQRDRLTIHGSAIAHKNHAYIFAGGSGAGKSTLTNAFYRKGYPLLADDISAISLTGKNVPVLYPGYPQVKLWENVLAYYNESISSLRQVRGGIKKYYYDMSGSFSQNILPVKHIFILKTHNKNVISLKILQGMEKFTALKNNTYRFHFLKGLGKEKTHFELCTKTAEKVSVTEIYRPMSPMEPEKLAEAVIKNII